MFLMANLRPERYNTLLRLTGSQAILYSIV